MIRNLIALFVEKQFYAHFLKRLFVTVETERLRFSDFDASQRKVELIL